MAVGYNWIPLRRIAVTHVPDLSQDPYQSGSILDCWFSASDKWSYRMVLTNTLESKPLVFGSLGLIGVAKLALKATVVAAIVAVWGAQGLVWYGVGCAVLVAIIATILLAGKLPTLCLTRSPLVLALVAIIVALQVIDCITTNRILAMPGGVETNPLMAWCIDHLGAWWWLPKIAIAYLSVIASPAQNTGSLSVLAWHFVLL
jgi:hypothetical protein